jgi:hypothetical protein
VNVTSPLVTSGGSAPPATAPVSVVLAGANPPEPIPVNSPLGLALLLLAIGGWTAWQVRARR